jgi:hypothetical protein
MRSLQRRRSWCGLAPPKLAGFIPPVEAVKNKIRSIAFSCVPLVMYRQMALVSDLMAALLAGAPSLSNIR